MHDFQKVARAHHQHLRRADGAATTMASESASASPSASHTDSTTSATKASSSSSSSSSSTTSSTNSSTTSSTPGLNVSSLIGDITSNVPSKTSTTSATSTSTTSSSTTPANIPTTPSISPAVTAPSAARALSTSQTVSSFSPTVSGTASATSSTSTDASSSGGLSSAATGGIVAACVIAGLALIIFVVRKTFIRRRKRKRNTWGAGIYPEINVTEKYGDNALEPPPPVPEKTAISSGYLGAGSGAEPRTPVWAPPRPVSPNPSTYYVTPPPMSYNNQMMDAAPGASLTPAAAGATGTRPNSSGSVVWSMSRPQSAAVETAIVRVVYIPTLPDELSIMSGEVVQVVQVFDDGWVLCRNARGEQGVVPLECLDRSAAHAQAERLSVGYGMEGGGDWRNMKRISSLSTQQPHY
ncbi:hypothetical protein EW145_g5100 [Phellinidium pouzarii]|uniref:SH3 domain-containing protein n=1 Tax=Phellinidium pouzarii TaxID=167371 RepID=A0A4S4L1R6_9AGAM|nr:hypothetical protein EW145_g5100 [Phellinidium pouzarii]